MTTQFCGLVALLLTACTLNGQSSQVTAGELSAEESFDRFARGILFLTCDVPGSESKQASGVLVSDDGFVITNAHAVEGCRGVTATYMNKAVRRSYSPVLRHYDKPTDTAVLKLPEWNIEHLELATRPVRVGERVYSIGNPRGLEQSISEGIVSGQREEAGVAWIQHSAPISPGSSGGALLSSRGELRGINAFLLKESQNLNFAVPSDALARALSAARARNDNLNYPQIPNAQPPAATLFNSAVSDENNGQLDRAISGYQNFIKFYPDNPNAARAKYNIGHCHYTQQRFDQAAEDFQKVIEGYREEPTLTPQAYFMKGMSLKNFNKEAAVATWKQLVARYPFTDAAVQANEQLRAVGRR